MINIRKGVFETNSSSMHSLTIKNEPINRDIDDSEIVIDVGNGEYGWSGSTLYSWEDKADYFGVECFYDDNKQEQLTRALKSKFPNAKIRFGNSGHIDHQSSGDAWNKVDSDEDLYDILFGDSYVTIDNDNH
jgi:hypothetical protein